MASRVALIRKHVYWQFRLENREVNSRNKMASRLVLTDIISGDVNKQHVVTEQQAYALEQDMPCMQTCYGYAAMQ